MAILTTEQLDKKETGRRGLTTEELDSMESSPRIEIDPEVIAKKRTSEVFGTIFGLDEPTATATYDTLAKKMYGENLKPSQVQRMMEDDGFQISPDEDEKDVTDFSKSMLERKESTVPADRQRREANRQIYNVFQSFQLADDIIFDPENEWYKTNIATKPKAKEGTLYSEPVHESENLLDFDTYVNLLEKSVTRENVEDLRRERKSLVARIYNDAFQQNADYYDIQEWSEFSTGSKLGDVTLEAAKGIYTALKTIEKGVWSTSVAMGMAWNQPNLDDVETSMKDARLTPMKAAGKIGYVTRAMSEAVPNFAYNMTVGTAGIFITEYGNARDDALSDGATETEAEVIAISVATINTIIEGWQIDKIFKIAGLGKGAKEAVKKAIKDRAYKAFLKGGAKFTGQSVLASINEGIEGFTQEGVFIAVPGFIIGNYPKDENGRIDWAGIMTRMGQSFVGEGLGGLLLGTGGVIYNARNVQNYKHDIALNLIVNEGMESKQALEVATNIVERLRNNEAAPKEIYRQEVGKIKMADNRAKAAVHVIKRGKEMPDEQYRQIAMDATGKESMVDMTYEEGEKFIDALNKAKVEKVEPEEGEVKEEVTERDITDEIEEIKQSPEVVSAEKQPQVMPPTEVMPKIVEPGIAPGARTGLPAVETVAKGAVQPAPAGVVTEKVTLANYDKLAKSIQDAIDARMDELFASGQSMEQALADPQAERLTQQRLVLDQQAINDYIDIVRDSLAEVGITDDSLTFMPVYSIAQDIYGAPKQKDKGDPIAMVYERGQDAMANELKTKAKLAEKIFRYQMEKQGYEPEGVLGPFSGLTEAGKKAELLKAAKLAEQVHESIKRKLGPALPAPAAEAPVAEREAWEMTVLEPVPLKYGASVEEANTIQNINEGIRRYENKRDSSGKKLTDNQLASVLRSIESGKAQLSEMRTAEVLAKGKGEKAEGKPKKRRGGFLSNTPFGNKGKLQQRVDEVVSLLGKPKKPPVEKKSLKELKRTDTLATFVNVAEDAVKGLDKAFGVMSTRIKNISQKLFQEVRNKYINPVKMIIADRTKKVHPFVDAIEKQLSEADRYDFEVARWTGDTDTVERIIDKYGLQEAYDKYRLVFDLMYHEGKAVGMDMNYMTAYFPSKVKDVDGLLKELNRREEYAPIVKALQEAQDKKGRALGKEEQIQILDTLLRGYRTTGISLAPPGFTRVRTLIKDDIALIKYYYGFAETTSRYIESMTENIQARKFFGKQTKEIVQLRANISRQKTNIAKWEKDTTEDRTENIQKAKDKLQEYETKLLTLDDGTLKASVGSYVLDLIEDGTINYDQQVELRQIFDGLFNTVGSTGWVHTVRSLEYTSSLAQVPALVTQYSEVVLSLLKAPITTLPNWVRAHLNKSEIKLKDIGVAHIGQEWADADFDATMTSLMKAFEKVDKIGKETFINSVVDKYRKMAKTNPDKVKDELAKYYPETEHDAVIESLKSGVVDNNIKGFALNELADVQPISKMEVPELYAKAGNLRVFYMYKTFTLKRLDIMRNQAYSDIKTGIKSGSLRQILKGLGKLVWLALMFTLADSSADIVKDVIRGKPLQEMPDYVVDNLLQMILLSKYSANKVRSEGLSAFLNDNIALPVSTPDAAARDIFTLLDEDSEKGSELARRIPWIGDLYYWHFGEGARKVEEGY